MPSRMLHKLVEVHGLISWTEVVVQVMPVAQVFQQVLLLTEDLPIALRLRRRFRQKGEQLMDPVELGSRRQRVRSMVQQQFAGHPPVIGAGINRVANEGNALFRQ